MPKIFISYRRVDSRDYADLIYEALEKVFGDLNVFRDQIDIKPGTPFDQEIYRQIEACDVMLVLIGTDWLEITDAEGKRRLDDPSDFVRIEVETALSSPSKKVIPVLLNKAKMPSREELPKGRMGELSRRQAFSIRPDERDVKHDIEALVDFIRPNPLVVWGRRLGVALAALVLLGLIGFGLLSQKQKDNLLMSIGWLQPSATATPAPTNTPPPTATLVPVPVSPTRIGIVPFANPEDCKRVSAQSLQKTLGDESARIVPDEDVEKYHLLQEDKASQKAAIRTYGEENSYNLMIWAACASSEETTVYIELLLSPVLYSVAEPQEIQFMLGDVTRISTIIQAVNRYLDRDYEGSADLLKQILRLETGQYQGQSNLPLLWGNSFLFSGCYEDAVKVYQALIDTAPSIEPYNNQGVALINQVVQVNFYQRISEGGDVTLPRLRDVCSSQQQKNLSADEMDDVLTQLGNNFDQVVALSQKANDLEAEARAYMNLGTLGYTYQIVDANDTAHYLESQAYCQKAIDLLPESSIGYVCHAMVFREFYAKLSRTPGIKSDVLCNDEIGLVNLAAELDNMPQSSPQTPSIQAEVNFWRGFVVQEWGKRKCSTGLPFEANDASQYYCQFLEWADQQKLNSSNGYTLTYFLASEAGC